MQVRAFLGTAAVLALLDTGSTHNFIAEHAARYSGLPIQPRPRLTAKVANGAKVTRPESSATPGSPSTAPRSASTSSSCPRGFDLVSQWLGTPGPIVWDVAARTMQFRLSGRTIRRKDQRQGRAVTRATTAPPTPPPAGPEPLLAAPLDSRADIFAEPPTAKAAAVSSLHHPIRRATKESSRRDIRLNLTLTSSKIRGPYKEDLLKDFACPQDDDMHRIGRTESDFLPWILYDSARIIDTAVGIRVVLFPCINTPLPKDDL
ncbi:hypothetical protein U9M48_032649, partial [Paspalum notatum var. saurae]